jgi:hypothetical protein
MSTMGGDIAFWILLSVSDRVHIQNKKTNPTAPKSDDVYLKLLVKVVRLVCSGFLTFLSEAAMLALVNLPVVAMFASEKCLVMCSPIL